MAIEFRVGYGDHLAVEDFVSQRPEGVQAITIEAPNLRFQKGLAEAVRSVGLAVLVDPLTERLVIPGYPSKGLNYAAKYPIRLSQYGKLAMQAQLVERVFAVQIDHASILVPPHFYAEDVDILELNVTLAGLGAQLGRTLGKPVRAVLAAPRTLLDDNELCTQIAREYYEVGIRETELRLSPLGGEEDSRRKISSALAIASSFKAAGLLVALGQQASIGQTALALGLADSYATGVGVREHFNFRGYVSQQREKKDGKRAFSASARVFLPVAQATVTVAVAKALYEDPGIRSRLACKIGRCASGIDGPLNDPRGHYLHSRANLVETTLGYPERWRPTEELTRLRQALDFREVLNRNYLDGSTQLRTRTVRALADEIENRIEKIKSA